MARPKKTESAEKKETKETKEVVTEKTIEKDPTQELLAKALAKIEELEKKIEEKDSQSSTSSREQMGFTQIKCISLCSNPINISTLPDGGGKLYEFESYGQSLYIRGDALLDIMSAYPRTMESGLIYICDPDFVKYVGLDYAYEHNFFTKEKIDEISKLNLDTDVEIIANMIPHLQESVINKIAEAISKGESYDLNRIDRLNRAVECDIQKMAKAKIE